MNNKAELSLQSLPQDILLLIALSLKLNDIRSLSLVSKYLNSVAKGILTNNNHIYWKKTLFTNGKANRIDVIKNRFLSKTIIRKELDDNSHLKNLYLSLLGPYLMDNEFNKTKFINNIQNFLLEDQGEKLLKYAAPTFEKLTPFFILNAVNNKVIEKVRTLEGAFNQKATQYLNFMSLINLSIKFNAINCFWFLICTYSHLYISMLNNMEKEIYSEFCIEEIYNLIYSSGNSFFIEKFMRQLIKMSNPLIISSLIKVSSNHFDTLQFLKNYLSKQSEIAPDLRIMLEGHPEFNIVSKLLSNLPEKDINLLSDRLQFENDLINTIFMLRKGDYLLSELKQLLLKIDKNIDQAIKNNTSLNKILEKQENLCIEDLSDQDLKTKIKENPYMASIYSNRMEEMGKKKETQTIPDDNFVASIFNLLKANAGNNLFEYILPNLAGLLPCFLNNKEEQTAMLKALNDIAKYKKITIKVRTLNFIGLIQLAAKCKSMGSFAFLVKAYLHLYGAISKNLDKEHQRKFSITTVYNLIEQCNNPLFMETFINLTMTLSNPQFIVSLIKAGSLESYLYMKEAFLKIDPDKRLAVIQALKDSKVALETLNTWPGENMHELSLLEDYLIKAFLSLKKGHSLSELKELRLMIYKMINYNNSLEIHDEIAAVQL